MACFELLAVQRQISEGGVKLGAGIPLADAGGILHILCTSVWSQEDVRESRAITPVTEQIYQ